MIDNALLMDKLEIIYDILHSRVIFNTRVTRLFLCSDILKIHLRISNHGKRKMASTLTFLGGSFATT
ncbi:MAG: hypothetical protein ACLR1O_06230, partial [Coprococcus phoceensis]